MKHNLRKFIEKNALAYSVAFVSSYQIDKNNILNSTFEAMHKSIEGLNIEPDFILVDGNLFKPYRDFKFKCIIKGDQKYQNIAAASILAKTYRDEYCLLYTSPSPRDGLLSRMPSSA